MVNLRVIAIGGTGKANASLIAMEKSQLDYKESPITLVDTPLKLDTSTYIALHRSVSHIRQLMLNQMVSETVCP